MGSSRRPWNISSTFVVLLLLVVVTLLLLVTSCNGTNDAVKLRRHLFVDGDIDPHTHPVHNQSDVVTVEVLFDLTHIHSMDEWTGTLTVNGFMTLIWQDQLLQWNPEDFGHLDHLYVPRNSVWQPDITLYNSAQPIDMDHYGNSMMYLTNDGTIHWFPPVTFHTSCPMDHKAFPFDQHVCSIVLGSWIYDRSTVDLQLSEEHNETQVGLLQQHFLDNPQWELVSIKGRRKDIVHECCVDRHGHVEYQLHIRRRSPIYQFAFVLLVLLSMALTLSLFWLPPNAGEKIVLGGTSLVVQVFLLLFLGWCIPSGGTSIPDIVLCCGNSLMMTALSLVLSVAVISISRCPQAAMDTPDAPIFLRTLLRKGLVLRLLCIRRPHLYEVSGSKLLDDNHVELGERTRNNSTDHHHHHLTPVVCPEWILLAKVIDRVSFVVYCVVFFVILMSSLTR